ncbi:MAG: alpha/beta fold hydrolase [Acidimicrobiales bacterium]
MEPARTPHPADPAVGLHADVIGRGNRIVMAHGFTQTGRLWGSLDSMLAADHEVMRVDMPGHGRSSRILADLTQGARLLGTTGGEAVYLGYSMGARFCLHLAVSQPELVRSLVLISGTAAIEDADHRAARRVQDEALADQLDPPHASEETGAEQPVDADQARIDDFLQAWLANPLFGRVPETANGLPERRSNTGPGLASSLRLAGTGTQHSLWTRIGRLSMPVLIVTGDQDVKFTEVGRRMAAAIGGNATHIIIRRCGHSPHLQRPAWVAEAVRSHLRRPDTAAAR